MKKIVGILTGDWHLREDTPVCRKDDFMETQAEMMDWFKSLQHKYSCPILHAGDLFHHWKPSPHLLNYVIKHIPDSFYTVAGNHDLPQHSMELFDRSGLGVLVGADVIQLLPHGHWRVEPPWKRNEEFTPIELSKGVNVVVQHIFTFTGELPYPGCTANRGSELLKQIPDNIQILHTGDNHEYFMTKYKGKTLFNAGAPCIQTADRIDTICKCGLVYSDGTVEAIEVPDFGAVISREHLERTKFNHKKYSAFIEFLKKDSEGEKQELNFTDNLHKYFEVNDVLPSVKNIILEKLEELK